MGALAARLREPTVTVTFEAPIWLRDEIDAVGVRWKYPSRSETLYTILNEWLAGNDDAVVEEPVDPIPGAIAAVVGAH